MAADAPAHGVTTAEDEYEYEYDATETETFYVDVDMVASHGLVEPDRPKKRKAETNTAHATPASTVSGAPAASRQSQEPRETPSHLPSEAGDVGQNTAGDETITAESTTEEIQILEPGHVNPVISYGGNYFSCTWADTIGTTMFFKEPSHGLQSTTPLLRGDGFDLQGISRIKLIAQKAKVTALPGRRKRPRMLDDEEEEIVESEPDDETSPKRSGKALGTLRSSNPITNLEIRKQASFLERLMDIKRKKGEKDNVRTAFPITTGSSKADRHVPPDGRAPRTKEDYAKEIEQLNRRVVRGDRDALFRLEEIYEQMEDEQQAPRPASASGDGAASATPSHLGNTPVTKPTTDIVGD